MPVDPDDDDALRWEGDDDPTLAPGWRRVGTVAAGGVDAARRAPAAPAPGSDATVAGTGAAEQASSAAPGTSAAQAAEADAATEAGPADAISPDPTQTGSVELIVLGVLGGVYLLYTVGWGIAAMRVTVLFDDPLGGFMFALGGWLAALAPVLWFLVTLWLASGRRVVRLVWLVVGAVVLVPVPFLFGVAV